MTYERHNGKKRLYDLNQSRMKARAIRLKRILGLPDIVTFLRSYDFTTDPKTAGNDPVILFRKRKLMGYFFRPLRAYIHSEISFSLSSDGQFSDVIGSLQA